MQQRRRLKRVALLPMKANSERVKGKNFKILAGKPLYRWILDTLLSIDEIDLVVINTDARHILESLGSVDTNRLLIRDRRPEICGDFVSMNRVIEDDIWSVEADLYLMTHTTNPLLSAATIRRSIAVYEEQIQSGQADSLFGVTRFQTRFYRADGSAVNHDPNNLLRTQDLEPWFEENSNIYIFSRDSFKATDARIGRRPVLFEIPKVECADIDGPAEWFIAESLAYRINEMPASPADAVSVTT